MKLFLAITLSALTLSVPAFADTIPAGAKVFGFQPTGTGEPTAVSCYRADVTGSHATKLVCHRNSEWASINARQAIEDRQPASTLQP